MTSSTSTTTATPRPTSAGGNRPKSKNTTNRTSEVDVQPIPDLKLAMTPENIKPLLENARVVTSQLTECIAETKVLLASSVESATPLQQEHGKKSAVEVPMASPVTPMETD